MLTFSATRVWKHSDDVNTYLFYAERGDVSWNETKVSCKIPWHRASVVTDAWRSKSDLGLAVAGWRRRWLPVQQAVKAVSASRVVERLPAMNATVTTVAHVQWRCRLRPEVFFVVVDATLIQTPAKPVTRTHLLAWRHRRPWTLLRRCGGCCRLRHGRHRWQWDRFRLNMRASVDCWSRVPRLCVGGRFGSRGVISAGVVVVGATCNRRRWGPRTGNFIRVVYHYDVDRVDILVVGLRSFFGQ